MGNSQSTGSELWFADIRDSAIQIQWDWSWTLLGVNFKNVKTGIKLLSGDGQVRITISIIDWKWLTNQAAW